jgi:hypothetical protein
MRKSEFLAEVRAAVCETADEGLRASGQTAQGCPWIEYWLTYYGGQDASHVERALQKFAPAEGKGTSARDYVPAVAARVRQSVDGYVKTGQAPDLPGAMLGGMGEEPDGLSISFKEREGGARAAAASPEAVQARLGGGQPLQSGVRSRMESAFGEGFSHVRVHTDARAASLSSDFNARAFTVGHHVAFSQSEYQPGTPEGDALLAHELAHTVQQRAGHRPAGSSMNGAATESLEADANWSAAGAIRSLWGTRDTGAEPSRTQAPQLRSSYRPPCRCP